MSHAVRAENGPRVILRVDGDHCLLAVAQDAHPDHMLQISQVGHFEAVASVDVAVVVAVVLCPCDVLVVGVDVNPGFALEDCKVDFLQECVDRAPPVLRSLATDVVQGVRCMYALPTKQTLA